MSPRQWAFLLAALFALIFFGNLSAGGPWDPWETHYGEVARNIVERGDPLELWWRAGYGPDGKREQLFGSKHALPFWCMAVSMKIFGVGIGAPDEMVRSPLPELALRLPSVIAGALTISFVAFVCARFRRWRAGLLAAAVLGTMPQFAILLRQATTDIYFIAPTAFALGSWALAWLRPDESLKTIGHGWRRLPWDRRYIAFILIFGAAAIVPLCVLHLHVLDDETIKRVARIGKPNGAPSLEGLDKISRHYLVYWALVALVLVRSLRFRSRKEIWLSFVYIGGGLALMGKGMLGPGIIGLVIAVHIVCTGQPRMLLKSQLLFGTLLFVLCCFPWHHGMWIFRGEKWVRELLIENNLARFASGEQEQAVGGVGYYLKTLGLAAFPWVLVVPAAIKGALSKGLNDRSNDESHVDGASKWQSFALIWFSLSLLVVTMSVTKYYHYLAPCLVPLALVVGFWLDAQLEQSKSPKQLRGQLVALFFGAVVVFSVLRVLVAEPAWIAHLTTYLYTAMWKKGAPEVDRLLWCCLPLAVGIIYWAFGRMRVFVATLLLSAFCSLSYVICDYLPAASESWSQRSAFQYYYDHRGPGDKLASWWFYYRGETFFSKKDIWVSVHADRKKLKELLEEMRGKEANLWIMTTASHAKNAKRYFLATYVTRLKLYTRAFTTHS